MCVLALNTGWLGDMQSGCSPYVNLKFALKLLPFLTVVTTVTRKGSVSHLCIDLLTLILPVVREIIVVIGVVAVL